MEDGIEKLFMTMTKDEIYAQTLKRRLLLAPVATEADIARDVQLKAREYWTQVDHTDTVGRTLTMPGPFAKLSETPIGSIIAHRDWVSTTTKSTATCSDGAPNN